MVNAPTEADLIESIENRKTGVQIAFKHTRVKVPEKDEASMTPLEKSLARRRDTWLKTVCVCLWVSLMEAFLIIGFGCTLGFDKINNAFFWSELGLAFFTTGVCFLTFLCSPEYTNRRMSKILVWPSLVLPVPRIVVPVVFVTVSGWDVLHTAGIYYWSATAIALLAVFWAGVFYIVLRYFRELSKDPRTTTVKQTGV